MFLSHTSMLMFLSLSSINISLDEKKDFPGMMPPGTFRELKTRRRELTRILPTCLLRRDAHVAKGTGRTEVWSSGPGYDL